MLPASITVKQKRFQMTFETAKADVITPKFVWERIPQLTCRSGDTETRHRCSYVKLHMFAWWQSAVDADH